ncbi:hypothetical protein BaRGS_00004685 [Batillaria attramentaria]|uniref:Uncharacterized protein n=1 Tax=Batillaria attramentaria TaxID=370345 RepID=A0ABD0LXY8_9CAEN
MCTENDREFPKFSFCDPTGECLKGDDCSSAAITCKLAGTVYCCGGAGSTVNASAVNGQLKFCTCESTPGITSSSCSEVNSASQLSGTFFTTAVAITVWSVLQA